MLIQTFIENYQGNNTSIFCVEGLLGLIYNLFAKLCFHHIGFLNLNILWILSEGKHIHPTWNFTIIFLLVILIKLLLSILQSDIQYHFYLKKHFKAMLVVAFHFCLVVVGAYFYRMFDIVAPNLLISMKTKAKNFSFKWSECSCFIGFCQSCKLLLQSNLYLQYSYLVLCATNQIMYSFP